MQNFQCKIYMNPTIKWDFQICISVPLKSSAILYFRTTKMKDDLR